MKKTKQILAWFMSAIIMLPVIASIGIISFAEEVDILAYLTYEIRNGEAAITDCDESISGDVVIPDTIEGCPVTSIGFFAFEECDNVTSITIPECITFIDSNAFYGCSRISEVYYGGNDAAWGWFSDDSGLPESCTVYFEKDSELIDYFRYSITNNEVTITDCSTTISGDVAIPDIIEGYPVTKINQQAFYNCKRLTGLIIPDSVTIIDDAAFWYCESLTNITIPKNTISIGECAFSYCSSLEQISVDKDNEYFSGDEYGVLFNKDKTELIQYPIGNNRATYSIPDSVTLIGFCSFEGCENLKNIIIGSNVKKIDSEAFENCSSLENVIIPESVTIINDFAFDGCDSIVNMTLEGFTTYIGSYAFGYEYVCEENNGVGSCFYRPIDGFVIYGIPNSASERYAKEYGFTFVSIAEDNYDEPSEKKELVVSDTCGNNLTWSLYSDGELIIEGTGNEYKFYRPTLASSWWFFREDIVSAKIKEGVTSIYTLSFRECTNLKSVFIPVSVDYISGDAFWDCSNLEIIYYAGTQEEWNSISGSEYLNIPIEFNCIDTDESVAEKNNVLDYLTYEIVDGKVKITGCDTLISGDVVIPDTIEDYPVTVIGNRAFYNCISLADIMLPGTVETIENNAFVGCTSLKKVIAPGVESIGEEAFSGCVSLDTFITFADTPTVADTAFDISENLTIFAKGSAAISAPVTLNIITFAHSDGTLSFSGEYKSDLYYLFDLVAVMCTYYDDVQYLFFDSFEAVSADDGHIYYYTDNWQRIEFDGTKITNVKFSVEAFDGEEFRKYSFNELCEAVGNNELENFNLVIEEADGLDKGGIELSLVDQISQGFTRLLKAIVNLLNKLFAFFRR